MERQHLSQTKNAIAPPQIESHASDRSSAHPIEELQGAIGNQAVNRLLANQPTLQAKPMFKGLSHELLAESQTLQNNKPIQAKEANSSSVSQAQTKNKTGLPDNLKLWIENLSGLAMDNVKVHYNSSKPSQIQALAYTQGTDIHVASGQERHLPHEAWHVVQQMQGRVRPTLQAKGVSINDDEGLEREADEIEARVLQTKSAIVECDKLDSQLLMSSAEKSVKFQPSGVAIRGANTFYPHMDIQQTDRIHSMGRGVAPIQMVGKKKYEIYIPADKNFSKTDLTGSAARDWLNREHHGAINALKEKYTLQFKDNHLFIVGVENRFELESLLKNKKLWQVVKIRTDEMKESPIHNQPEETGKALSEEELVAESNIETMKQINQEDTISYPYNVDAQEIARLSQILQNTGYAGTLADAYTGFANPQYFRKTEDFTWELNPQTSASEAIQDFINLSKKSTIIAECQTTAQAVNYYTLLQMVGSKKFDQYFGSAKPEIDRNIHPNQRLLLQKKPNLNPIDRFFQDFRILLNQEEESELSKGLMDDDWVSMPGYRPAQVGGFYFIKNHEHYTIRHSQGFLMGENAFYYGRDKVGEQRFGGLGLEKKTEMEILKVLADAFNQAPKAEEVETIYAQGNDLRYPGIQLPELGKVMSIDKMPLNANIIAFIQQRYNQFFPQHPRPINAKNAYFAARLVLYEQIKQGKLVKPVSVGELGEATSRNQMNQEASDEIAKNPTKYKKLNMQGVVWSTKDGKVVMDRTDVGEKFRGISLSTAVDEYINKFNLDIPSGWLQILIRELNPVFSKSANYLINCERIEFPEVGTLLKLRKTHGGFQSLHSKVLDPGKIKKTFGLKQLVSPQIQTNIDELGVRIRATVENGDCMYDAIHQQLFLVEGINISINQLRTRLATLIFANQEYFRDYAVHGIDRLIMDIITTRSWNNEAGDIAAQVLPTILQRDIVVISPNGIDRRQPNPKLKLPQNARVQSNGNALTIVYNGVDHYFSTE